MHILLHNLDFLRTKGCRGVEGTSNAVLEVLAVLDSCITFLGGILFVCVSCISFNEHRLLVVFLVRNGRIMGCTFFFPGFWVFNVQLGYL